MKMNKKDIASIAIFIVLILSFVLLINGITTKNNGRELQIVRDAVKNAALTCYAVEGVYPDDLVPSTKLIFSASKLLVKSVPSSASIL